MDDIKNLLPIGSIVRLKKGKKQLMIAGVKHSDSKTHIEYDYIGVLYPEGYLEANTSEAACTPLWNGLRIIR